VVADVPFVDALTTMLDATLPLTVGEWEEWATRRERDGLSHDEGLTPPTTTSVATNPDGTHALYPHLLRVGWAERPARGIWEPTKWVLKIRDANAENVAYLKTEMGGTRWVPRDRYDAWRDEAQVLA